MGVITQENYAEFKKCYEETKTKGESVFWFEGQQVLTDYAKYVVQYIESRAEYQAPRRPDDDS